MQDTLLDQLKKQLRRDIALAKTVQDLDYKFNRVLEVAEVVKSIGESSAVQMRRINSLPKGEKGDKGDSVRGLPGKDARDILHVGSRPPTDPKIGDIWYQN